jgi:hypothetical protein
MYRYIHILRPPHLMVMNLMEMEEVPLMGVTVDEVLETEPSLRAPAVIVGVSEIVGGVIVGTTPTTAPTTTTTTTTAKPTQRVHIPCKLGFGLFEIL